jgi:opacity protein-like surface antigen
LSNKAKEQKMAKKGLLVLVLAVLVAGGAFAQFNFSVGGLFGNDFGGGLEASGNNSKSKMEMPYAGGGGYLFFDATYAELSLGVFYGSGSAERTIGTVTRLFDRTLTSLNIGLLGKYPFAINESLILFPLLGIDYQVVLAAKWNGRNFEGFSINEKGGPNDFNALWFQFGGGVDYSFTSNIFLRCEALYGIRLANKVENDMTDNWKGPGISVNTLLGHGLTVKLAVGWRF